MIVSYAILPWPVLQMQADAALRDLWCVLVALGAATPVAQAVVRPSLSGYQDVGVLG